MNDSNINHYISLVGYVTIAYILIKCLPFVWLLFKAYFLTSFGLIKNLKKYGEWVIVTGATDGIGKQYAKQFAKQGFKIILISRTRAKLESVAREIIKEFNVDVKIITFDFTLTDGYDEIEKIVSDLDIGILVNNVGMAGDGKGLKRFHETDMNHVRDKINCNIFSDVTMTHMITKGMVARGRGLILHISSASIFLDLPYFVIYPSTKKFMEKTSKSLLLEYSGVIDHQLVTPGYVATNMSNKKTGFTIPSAENYVITAMRTIGIMDYTCGYFSHEILRLVFLFTPQWLLLYSLQNLLKKKLKMK